jgi:hypothetical protein
VSRQDEQRRLDEELPAGQLSAADYQRRHDELVPRHPGGAADAANTLPDTTQRDSSATPFPPAFRWESAQPDESDETTQLFIPVAADETQVMNTQPDDTQVVHGGPGGQQEPQLWGATRSAPPWASSEMPPMQQPDPAWTAHGPGSFASKRSSRAPRVAAVVALAVMLVAAGGLGAYWLWGPDGASQAEQPPAGQQRPAPAQQPAADQQPPAPPAPRPGSDLPDPAEIGGDGQPRVIPTLSELRATGVLTPEEYAAVTGAGATASKLLVSSFEEGPTASMLIIRLDGGDEAAATRDELAALQEQAGFKSAPTPDPGLRSLYVVDDPEVGPTVRGYYRSADLLVRMEVVGAEPVPTARRYDIIAEQQLATLPADE